LNGKKWRSIVSRTYSELFEEFQVPKIPLEFSNDGSDFAREAERNSFSTTRGKLREKDGIPFFLFPIYPDLGKDYASRVVKERGGTASVPHEEPKPAFVMRHEFYHYLEFLTHGPMSKEELTEEYHKNSEAEANDFAIAYEG
jgi:hypothetical protein